MSYDPTQQVPPPQGYPPQQGYPQQPGYTQQGYPQQPGYPPAYPQQPPTPQPYQQYGAPPPAGAGFDFNAFWKKLGLTGQVCSIAGLVLFFSFFFPWFSASDSCSGSGCLGFTSVSASASGFTVANGGTEGFSFAFLWLVFIASLALIALPIITAMGKLAAKTSQLIILIAAGVCVLFEVIYMFQAFGALKNSTGTFTEGNTTVSVSAGPAWGFWLALLATLAAGGVYLYFGYIKKPAVAGYPLPYQQAAQYPGAQPYQPPTQYPGSQPYAPPTQYQQPPQYPGQQPPQYPGQ